MTRHEVIQRLRNPAWVYSLARDAFLDCHDRMSRSEFARLYRLVRPHTMTGNARLRGLYDAVRRVLSQDVPGDIVECGVARGGSAALMGLVLQAHRAHRRLWAFDTFEGLPPPSEGDPDFEIAKLYTGLCRGTLEDVTALFERLGIMERTVLVKGLFQETLPTAAVGPIAVLHLDGDWYESVRICLDQLYDRVSPGGAIQIDDYGHWEGARKAVDEFLRHRGLSMRLTWIDYTGRRLTKP